MIYILFLLYMDWNRFEVPCGHSDSNMKDDDDHEKNIKSRHKLLRPSSHYWGRV